jgi:hypothetical protein
MAPLLNQQFKAFVGIDWADTKHDICLQPAGEGRREFDCIERRAARTRLRFAHWRSSGYGSSTVVGRQELGTTRAATSTP